MKDERIEEIADVIEIMKAMGTLQDLIEEAKVRTLWWAICVFGIAYFLSHTSKSLWANIPISFLMLSALRLLSHKVEFRWKVRLLRQPTYLSHLQKKQLSLDDPRIAPLPTATKKWKRKIGSPLVEAAVDDFINKILQDFMIDLWYSEITPDREAPELIHRLIKDVIGEISGRVKEINLVDLLTRDMVDLIGNHIDLYRRNQSSIGVDVMGTLSSEERDERLRHHLIASKELHPALFSSECEYKVLQRLMGGVLAVVLRPREADCSLVRCLGQEFLTCLVMQPIMNFACPGYINELIEFIILALKDYSGEVIHDKPDDISSHLHDHSTVGINQSGETQLKKPISSSNQLSHGALTKISDHGEKYLSASEPGHIHMYQGDSVRNSHPPSSDWARVLDAAQQRRTQVLAPENLENMWARGRNYKTKTEKIYKAAASGPKKTTLAFESSPYVLNRGNEKLIHMHGNSLGAEAKSDVQELHGSPTVDEIGRVHVKGHLSQDLNKGPSIEGGQLADEWDDASQSVKGNKTTLRRSSSTSDLKNHLDIDKKNSSEGEAMGSKEFHIPYLGKEERSLISTSALRFHNEGLSNAPKLICRVVGAYFEKIGSKSFAVYSIAVRDAENKIWNVKRRYRNFERLHRHLKDIPNYNLHLPPKRFLSSSIDDSFVHQRCILLDKYLQDLLSIANVAEQHEVWDFLCVSSKNYAFGKSTSVMKTLAVNVDDAMDDFVRQFKGVSGGLLRAVSGSSFHAAFPPITEKHMALYWNDDELNRHNPNYSNMETSISLSDNDESVKDGAHDVGSAILASGWHSDNELNSKGFPPRVIKHFEESRGAASEKSQHPEINFGRSGFDGHSPTDSFTKSDLLDDPVRVPPEWTPPNLSVPLLNLVDNIFQLNRRGWLRRQVFWISKQILQLVMEDAIDDWLLRQINWLRRDDIIAQGIRWVQDVLWPNGTFFLKLESSLSEDDDDHFSHKPTLNASRIGGNKIYRPGSFESQLEAARRASDVKKLLLDGAPTALVSLIGHKQYRRCAKDIYYFLQSTVCLKQLAYCMLELVLVSLFPELHDLVQEIHEKAQFQAA